MLQVIGAGLGRTGTLSLKLALERLGFGPCHHMEEVFKDLPSQVRLWEAATAGRPDWEATFAGFRSAVDWPTAGFAKELAAAFPDAKVVEVASADAAFGVEGELPEEKVETVDDSALQDLESSTGLEQQKKSAQLPDTLGTGGEAPKEDKAAPGGGSEGEAIE